MGRTARGVGGEHEVLHPFAPGQLQGLFDQQASDAAAPLAGIDHLRQSATLHIMIGSSKNRGRGMGTFAVLSMLRHAFYDLNLHRVELSVLATNEAAIGMYEKCGFSREGTRRQACYKQGKFVDMYEYGILRGEERELS